jgi:hypothetical protein
VKGENMKITFTDTNTKLSTKEYVAMTKFMCDLLLKRDELKDIVLNVSFDRNNPMNRGLKGHTMHQDDNEYEIWIRPTMSSKEQRLTFAHELVHLKQYVRKELCPFSGKVLSKSLQSLNPNGSDDYYDNPTEIEAYGRAPGLVARYTMR